MPSPSEIVERINRRDLALWALHERMENDWERFRLDPFDPSDPDLDPYTSNGMRTFALKVMAWLTGAQRQVRVPNVAKMAAGRAAGSAKERLIIGALFAADDVLVHRFQPSLQDQLAFHCALRGMYAGRATFVMTKDGSTTVDITPWDPLNTFWDVGSEGPIWACNRFTMMPAAIKDEFDVDLSSDFGSEDLVTIYDWYDAEGNQVSTEDRILKPMTPHHIPGRMPVFLGPVGSVPMVNSRTTSMGAENALDTVTFGESIYQSSRDIIDRYDEAMSRMLTLVNRSAKEGIKVFSASGSKTLDESPYVAGSELSLRSGEEDVVPLGLQRMSADAQAFLAIISGEFQRATLPFTAYGEIPFQLSGFAINTLRQGIDASVQPCIKAMELAYRQIANLLVDQYATGKFRTMSFQGPLTHHRREWFMEEIRPEDIMGSGPIDVRLLPNLPSDDPAKYQMAALARDASGGIAMLSDRTIRDMVLGLQDVDQEEDMIKEELSERATPMASMYSLILASQNRGRPDLAQIYQIEAQIAAIKKQLELFQGQSVIAQAGMMGPGGPGGPGGGPPGMSPSVSPPAAAGVPPPTPTPQAGPNVPPGSPRPGALSDAERLAAMGLVGPGG